MASWYDRYRQFAQAQWEPTVLSSQEEAAFREWLIKSKWFQQIRDDVAASGERVDDAALYEELTGPRADYDYRGAWKAGVGAQDYEFDDRMHWPSSTADGRMLKSPKHPTAWMEYFMQDTGVVQIWSACGRRTRHTSTAKICGRAASSETSDA